MNIYRTHFQVAMRYLLFTILCFTLVINGIGQSFPIIVNVALNPPAPVNVAELYERDDLFLMNVINNSNNTISVAYKVTLTNLDQGFSIESDLFDLNNPCMEVLPGVNELTTRDLGTFFEPAAANSLIFTGITYQELERDPSLRDGTYTFCVQAYDCFDEFRPLSPPNPSGCAMFTVQTPDPPVVGLPCGVVITPNSNVLSINWTFIRPPGFTDDIYYSIRIVPLEPGNRAPQDAIESATYPLFFEEEVVNANALTVSIPEDLDLKEATTYAVRVQAYDLLGQMRIKNNGYSEVCTFVYNQSHTEGGGIEAYPMFPVDGDVIPFSFFPIVVQWGPYDNEFDNYLSNLQLYSVENGLEDTYRAHNRWPWGPMETQRRVLCDDREVNQIQSQTMPAYKNFEKNPITFVRGKRYYWMADIELRKKGDSFGTNIPQQFFEIGMKEPHLISPLYGDVVRPADMVFTFDTGDPAEKLVPDHIDIRSKGGINCEEFGWYEGHIHERWMLEVSKSPTFDSLAHFEQGEIGGENSMLSLSFVITDSISVADSIYKEISFNWIPAEGDTGTFYWRVKWAKNPEQNDTLSYRRSEVGMFIIDEEKDTPTIASTPAPEDTTCRSSCEAFPPASTTPTFADPTGKTLTLGLFQLQIQSVTQSSGSEYSGTGIIPVTFLNNVKVQVRFRNLQYNGSDMVFAGDIRAMQDNGTSFTVDSIGPNSSKIASMAPGAARALNQYLSEGNRVASTFSGDTETPLPIGIDREVGGRSYVLAITDMVFTPTGAQLSAMANIDVPGIGDHIISMGATGVCFSPNGLGQIGNLNLARELVIPMEGGVELVFYGVDSPAGNTSTNIGWNCEGLSCLNVNGHVRFPRSMVVPDGPDGKPTEGNVKGAFHVQSCNGFSDFMAGIDLEDFQIPGAEGWSFGVTSAYMDMSSLENPPNIQFPAAYADTSVNNPRFAGNWTGFYLETLSVRTPKEFSTSERSFFGVRNLIIDRTGVSGSLRAENVLSYIDGNVKGWGFSLDTIQMTVASSSFVEAGMSGKIGMPIMQADDYLRYRALLSNRQSSGLVFDFQVRTEDTIDVEMVIAQLQLEPNSYVNLSLSSDSSYVEASLSGNLNISDEYIPTAVKNTLAKAPALKMPELAFQDLRIDSENGIDAERVYFSHASPQKEMAGFPLTIDSIKFTGGLANPSLLIKPKISLAGGESGFAAAATIIIESELNWPTGGKQFFGLKGINLSRIEIDVTASAMRLYGYLDFYNDDPVYGDGVAGGLDITLPMGIRANLNARFGTIRSDPAATFNTAGYYSYWYVDAMVGIPEPGIVIFSGISIYGFGGGAYYHMRMDQSNMPAASQTLNGGAKDSQLPQSSGVTYIPDYNTFLGLKLMAVFGTSPKSDAFNMDVGVQAEFNSSGGLNMIRIRGDAYMMAPVYNRGQARVWGSVDIVYSRPAESSDFVHGEIDVFMNYGMLRGRMANHQMVDATFHAESDLWYFHAGTPAARGGLLIDLNPLPATIDLNGYLMIGHNLPSTLPPPPDEIMALLNSGGPGQGSQVNRNYVNKSRPNMPIYTSGQGFAFGSAMDLDPPRLWNLIFYADLRLMLGYDINVTHSPSRICQESGLAPGTNGWYAQGQAYAGAWGDFGIYVNVFFFEGEISFLRANAALLLQAALPSPTYFKGRARLNYSVLGGLIEGNHNFELTLGDPCTAISNNPFEDISFIADMQPEGNPVSVFSNPTASFHMPVERIIEIPVMDEHGNYGRPRRFEPYVYNFTVTENASGLRARGIRRINQDGTVAYLKLRDMLNGQTAHTARLEVRAREYFFNGSSSPVLKDGQPWSEIKEVTFTTGTQPDSIPEENVAFTYPIKRQNYFLKGETFRNQGFIRLNTGMPQLFAPTIDGKNYDYFARFTRLAENDVAPVDVPINYSGGRAINFNLPPLDNEEIYAIQIIRKEVVPTQTVSNYNGLTVNPALSGAGGNTQLTAHNLNNLATVATLVNVYSGGQQSIRSQAKELPGAIVDESEKLLYKLYFRTSQFNTLQEKLSNMQIMSVGYGFHSTWDEFGMTTRIAEPFDEFDMIGYYKDGIRQLEPLVRLTDPFFSSSAYHNSIDVYDVRSGLRSASTLGRFTVAPLNFHGRGIPPRKSIRYDMNSFTAPLSNWHLHRALGNHNSSGGSNISFTGGNTSTVASGMSMGQNPNMQASSTFGNNSFSGGISFGNGNNLGNALGGGLSSSLSVNPSGSGATFANLPTESFLMYMQTPFFVVLDFHQMRDNIAAIRSNPQYWNYVRQYYPNVYSEANQLMGKIDAHYHFSGYMNQDYTISLTYRRPSNGNSTQRNGTYVNKVFRY